MALYSLIATILVTELGLFQRIFDTASLSLNQWVICAAVGALPALAMEIGKIFRRREVAAPAKS